MISIRGLNKFFNKGRQNEIHVINDVSLELPERGMAAIYGKSGCGKTTLLNVIGGLDKFSEGTLTIEGQSIKENTDVIRNKYIGYIFQNYNLNKSETCFDNVASALRLCGMDDENEIKERVSAALSNVGMEKYLKRYPDTLSGGQQQRIAIARAIVKNPRIILADEPTGNLDEANTVMIMDLLKAISRDHLVILVTHEANLVDYYCDTVIEISDGKVASVKHNASSDGFYAKDKNDIYLGELNRSIIADENAEIEYYGDKPGSPIRLKIVNNGGKIYVQLGTEKVHVLDEHSEVKLREGVYEEKAKSAFEGKTIDMSKLPEMQGKEYGKLFSFKSSLKSGYAANFAKRKKGKSVLCACMALFAAVIVFMSSVFGLSFDSIEKAQNAYNHNVFYVYTPDGSVSQKLMGAVGMSETGIDCIRLSGMYPSGDETVNFRTGTFETFYQYDYESNFRTNAVYLSASLADNLELVEGKKDNLSDTDILITAKVADELLKKSTLGYITERGDLIGLVSNSFTIGGMSPRIAGIVESDESAIYLSEIAMARYVRNTASFSYTALASDFGIDAAEGEAILALRNPADTAYPALNETIKIQGRDIKIVGIKSFYTSYDAWLAGNGISKKEISAYFSDAVKSENPSLDSESEEFLAALDSAMRDRYYEYFDYYYAEADAYVRDYYFFNHGDIELWLYADKGIEEGKYSRISEEYYKALKYKELYGVYPTKAQLESAYESLPYTIDALDKYAFMYQEEFYSSYRGSLYQNTYMVSSADYAAFSKQLGETHPTAKVSYESENYDKYTEAVPYEYVQPDVEIDSVYYGGICYTVIHSNDPAKTAEWLYSEFSELSMPNEFYEPIITPDSIFESIIKEKRNEIITGLVTMAAVTALMSLCMYFIMRSSLLSRIKEVGIYRAIGVSKRNLVFKFFVEALVLTALTVLVGFFITSAFLFICGGMSSLISELFYYPLWLAGVDLVILCAISLLFGTLPIISLLRKTPSEILAKYDI